LKKYIFGTCFAYIHGTSHILRKAHPAANRSHAFVAVLQLQESHKNIKHSEKELISEYVKRSSEQNLLHLLSLKHFNPYRESSRNYKLIFMQLTDIFL
jgi:hypothetical protein